MTFADTRGSFCLCSPVPASLSDVRGECKLLQIASQAGARTRHAHRHWEQRRYHCSSRHHPSRHFVGENRLQETCPCGVWQGVTAIEREEKPKWTCQLSALFVMGLSQHLTSCALMSRETEYASQRSVSGMQSGACQQPFVTDDGAPAFWEELESIAERSAR